MRWTPWVWLALAGIAAPALARDWHVAPGGHDGHDGLTPASAVQTLQQADRSVQPGDRVLVAPGLYLTSDGSDRADGSAVLTIRSRGRPDAWITWQALPGGPVELRPTGWAGIQITGAYQVIDGFTVTGANDRIVLAQALDDARKPQPDPRFNTNGIVVEGRHSPPEAKPHHIVVRRCVVSKLPGGGITVLEADQVTIEDNLVFDNAWFMRYGGSGITFLHNWQADDAPGYHVVVQRNQVWNNKTLVPWERTGRLSDGNGILLDVTDQQLSQGATNPNADGVTTGAASAAAFTATASIGQRPAWTARSLIANNLSAFNGGSGIHTFRTAHVDIVNNTTYWNGGIVGYPELFANRSDDVVIVNNLMVPRPGGQVTSNHRNTRLQWDHNLYPAAQGVVRGDHDTVAEPRFVNVQTDLRQADFRLRPGSPGLATGSPLLPQATDLAGRRRPAGGRVSQGAYAE